MSATRVNVILPDKTLESMRLLVRTYGRSQFLNYAALALVARLRGDLETAFDYERAARAMMRDERGPSGAGKTR